MITEWKDGMVVELTRTIENPTPDRRARYDWRKAKEVPAGARFIVRRRKDDDGVKEIGIDLEPESGYGHMSLWLRSDGSVPERGTYAELTLRIVPFLEERPATLRTVFRRHYSVVGSAAWRVLSALVDSGAVTLADVEAELCREDNHADT